MEEHASFRGDYSDASPPPRAESGRMFLQGVPAHFRRRTTRANFSFDTLRAILSVHSPDIMLTSDHPTVSGFAVLSWIF